jgi:hypothetical protein
LEKLGITNRAPALGRRPWIPDRPENIAKTLGGFGARTAAGYLSGRALYLPDLLVNTLLPGLGKRKFGNVEEMIDAYTGFVPTPDDKLAGRAAKIGGGVTGINYALRNLGFLKQGPPMPLKDVAPHWIDSMKILGYDTATRGATGAAASTIAGETAGSMILDWLIGQGNAQKLVDKLPTVGPKDSRKRDIAISASSIPIPKGKTIDFGIKEILKSVKELIAPTNPYMRRESEKITKEMPARIKNAVTMAASPMAALIPGVTVKELQKELREEAKGFGGFGSATIPAAGKAGATAVTAKGLQAVGKGTSSLLKLFGKGNPSGISSMDNARIKEITKQISDMKVKGMFDKARAAQAAKGIAYGPYRPPELPINPLLN